MRNVTKGTRNSQYINFFALYCRLACEHTFKQLWKSSHLQKLHLRHLSLINTKSSMFYLRVSLGLKPGTHFSTNVCRTRILLYLLSTLKFLMTFLPSKCQGYTRDANCKQSCDNVCIVCPGVTQNKAGHWRADGGAVRPTDWLNDLNTDWLKDSLSHWLPAWLIFSLTDWLPD